MAFDPNDPTNVQRVLELLEPCSGRKMYWTVTKIAAKLGWTKPYHSATRSHSDLQPIRLFLESHPDRFWKEVAQHPIPGGSVPAQFWHAVPCGEHEECIIRSVHES